jgi:hypothetical protein
LPSDGGALGAAGGWRLTLGTGLGTTAAFGVATGAPAGCGDGAVAASSTGGGGLSGGTKRCSHPPGTSRPLDGASSPAALPPGIKAEDAIAAADNQIENRRKLTAVTMPACPQCPGTIRHRTAHR